VSEDPNAALDRDIERLALQERRLRFSRFDENTAFALGCGLRALCIERGIALAIEVRWMRRTVFRHTMAGTSAANDDWVRRKRNTVELFGQSSYAVGRMLAREGESLDTKMGLATRDFATFGGGFPVLLEGAGCVGAVTVSGLPQREDHALVVQVLVVQVLVVQVLADLCGVPLAKVVLED